MSAELNVLKHEMVPEQLPKMYHDDPAVLSIGARISDVIKIVRKSMTAGRAESYRLVVRRPKK